MKDMQGVDGGGREDREGDKRKVRREKPRGRRRRGRRCRGLLREEA